MRPRLLMLSTALGQGGAERVFDEHANAFAARYQVEQVVFERGGESFRRSELPLHVLDELGPRIPLGAPGRLLSRAIALRRLARARGADLVVSHMDGANWVNALSLSAARKLLVVHGSILHDRRQHGWRQWLRRLLVFPILYNLADRTVGVSREIAGELRHAGVRHAEAIENWFEVDRLRALAALPLPPEAVQALRAPCLVTSGRLSVQKNQAALFPMLRALRERHPGLRLVLLGDGELRGELEAAAAHAGLRCGGVDDAEADVVFAGYRDNPFAWLAHGTLFVFPSAWEGFPLALCEAMACGIPVASADCPTGPREILAPGSVRPRGGLRVAEPTPRGLLLPPPESDAARAQWVSAIDALLGDAARREAMSVAGLQAVRELDRPRLLARWFALFDAVLGTQPGVPGSPARVESRGRVP